MLLALLVKFLSILGIEYSFHYLSTAYVDATIEFMQAYIQIVDLIRSQREEPQHRDATAPG